MSEFAGGCEKILWKNYVRILVKTCPLVLISTSGIKCFMKNENTR
jgi:hypothetical protein